MLNQSQGSQEQGQKGENSLRLFFTCCYAKPQTGQEFIITPALGENVSIQKQSGEAESHLMSTNSVNAELGHLPGREVPSTNEQETESLDFDFYEFSSVSSNTSSKKARSITKHPHELHPPTALVSPDRWGSPSTSAATTTGQRSNRGRSLIESEKALHSPSSHVDNGSPGSHSVTSNEHDEESLTAHASFELAITMDDVDQPWRDETRPPPVLSSQISSIKEGDSLSDRTDALTQVIHMEQQLFHVNHLIKEAEMLYLDERLLEAWVVAETCLRLASRYAESIEPQFEDGKKYAKLFQQAFQTLTQSPSYIGISTKFDLTTLGARELSFAGKNRMFSKESFLLEALEDAPVGEGAHEKAFRKSFFRLHSRRARKHTQSAGGKLPDGRVPLFQILAILHETDGYDNWVPYCKKCTNLGQSSKASMILQQVAEYPWPLKLKETISFCFGVDALDEFGCVLLNSTGLDEKVDEFLGFKIPPPQKKCPRIPSSNFLFLLYPVHKGNATTVELFANIDPGITTLRSVILPVIKIVIVRSVKGFFHKIGVLASNFQGSSYEEKIKQHPEIYDWIKKRISESDELGRLRRGSSVQTLILDELKESDKK